MAVLIHTVCVLVPAVEVKLAVVSGFTVTVAVMGISAQVVPPLVYDGVIVNVTVTGAAVVLVSVPLILPVPLAAIPVTEAVLSLVQLYTVPVTLPLFTIVVMADPVQLVCEAGVATAFGMGFTTAVAVMVDPKAQPPAFIGVMVKVTVMGALVVLVRDPLILPVPLAAIPVTPTVLSLVQLNEPATLEASTTVVTELPEQIV